MPRGGAADALSGWRRFALRTIMPIAGWPEKPFSTSFSRAAGGSLDFRDQRHVRHIGGECWKYDVQPLQRREHRNRRRDRPVAVDQRRAEKTERDAVARDLDPDRGYDDQIRVR